MKILFAFLKIISITIVAIVFVTVYNLFCWGFVSSVIVNKFLIPTYLPNLSILPWTFYSLLYLVVQCLTHTYAPNIQDRFLKREIKFEIKLDRIIAPWLMLLIAYIFHIFFN